MMAFQISPTIRAAAFLVLLVPCAEAAEPASTPVPAKELQSKLQYCQTCHGTQGQGYRGAAPMPRLAGQQVEYIENQLKAFIERNRENRFMFGVAHTLTPAMITALAKHFNSLNPKPLGGAPLEHVAAGKTLFEEGVPTASVPPCASCHGADAKGNGLFPRLAGQLYDYTIKGLANWSKDRGLDPKKPDNSAMMAPIAHGLSEAQVKAVAAYVSTLQ